jgi:hypothetical protein
MRFDREGWFERMFFNRLIPTTARAIACCSRAAETFDDSRKPCRRRFSPRSPPGERSTGGPDGSVEVNRRDP